MLQMATLNLNTAKDGGKLCLNAQVLQSDRVHVLALLCQ